MTIIPTTKPLRKRDPNDFYPTPSELCEAALDLIPNTFTPGLILDPGCGTGVWGQAARLRWYDARIEGVEIRDIARPEGYDHLDIEDFRLLKPAPVYDAVIGNPPYKYAESFVRLGMDSLLDGGYMVYLLRLAFLEGQKRAAGLWRKYRPTHVAVCSKRPSFSGNRKTDATAYAIFVWQKGLRVTNTELSFLSW